MQQLIHYAVNSPLGIIGWSLIALLVFFWLIRSSPKLLGAIVLLIVLALLAHAAVERMERAATAAVDNATNTVSNAVPDWAKRLWQKVKRPLGNFGESKLCDYAGIKTICDWYDALAQGIDRAGPEHAQRFLAKLALLLGHAVGDPAMLERAIETALRDL